MEKLKTILRGDKALPKWVLGLALLWVCTLAYGALIPTLGFYADDWPFIYVADKVGAAGIIDFIAWVRPFAGWMFALPVALFGKTFALYHVWLLVFRWIDALLLFWVLRMVWPGQTRPAVWAALIFAVYPAFKQQPLALEYFPHFFVLMFFFISLGTMLLAVKDTRKKRLYSLISLISALSMFSIEYFIGQEILRPVLLWIVMMECEPDWRRRARAVMLRWLPYLAVLVIFLLWRVFIVQFPTYQPQLVSGLASNPLAAAAHLGGRIALDLYTVTLGAWIQVFTFPSGLRSAALYLVLVLAAFIPLGFYLLTLRDAAPGSDHRWRVSFKTALPWLVVGFISLLASGWPFWITDLPVQLTFPWDRPTLSFMLGVSLLTAGVLLLLRERCVQALLLAFLISLSVGLHFQNANTYRKEWSLFNSFFWQLTWRAPGLQPGTTLALDYSPFSYHIDKFLVPALNFTYAPESRSLAVPYNIHDFYKLQGSVLEKGQPYPDVRWGYGTISFQGAVDDMLMVDYNPPACLRVLTAPEGDQMMLSENFRAALNLSNLDQIIVNAAPPAEPPIYLGSQPKRAWCYYFEKADLARQMGDFAGVAALGDEARQAGYSAAYPAEWLVFVEGYAQERRWDDARQASERALTQDFFRNPVCSTWERLSAQGGWSAEDMRNINDIQHGLGCGG